MNNETEISFSENGLQQFLKALGLSNFG